MRTVAFGLCLLALGTLLNGQQGDTDPYSLKLVSNALSDFSRGLILGYELKNLPVLGDRGAIAILKIENDENLLDPQTVRPIIRVIRIAFSSPDVISIPEDKKPMVTMFLLNYMEASVQDAGLKQDIQKTIDYVRLQSSTYSGTAVPSK
jgi:hypothetical protein